MIRLRAAMLVAAMCISPPLLAEANSEAGTIKGTVTIGGRPTDEAVVSVVGLPPSQTQALLAETPTRRAVMDQRDLKFSPHVLPIASGTTVDFPNDDNTWHNVYSKGGVKDFDLGLYPPGKSRNVTFDQPGVDKILCNAHPNMEAFIVVTESPFFSGTDARGNYQLDGLPVGKYRIQVWHPELGTKETSVELIREGQVLDLNFDLKK